MHLKELEWTNKCCFFLAALLVSCGYFPESILNLLEMMLILLSLKAVEEMWTSYRKLSP